MGEPGNSGFDPEPPTPMASYPTPAGVRSAPAAAPSLDRLLAIFRGGVATSRALDAIWAPAVAAMLIVVSGSLGYWMKQPWLFAGIGPTAFLLASNPGHETTRFRSVFLGHLTAIACGYLAVLILGAGEAPALLSKPPLLRVWASAFGLAMLAFVQPQLKAWHPPAAATLLLVTMGAYRMTGKTPLALMCGVLVVAVVAEALSRLRTARR